MSLLLLSLVLMLSEQHVAAIQSLRNHLESWLHPIAILSQTPHQLWQWSKASSTSRSALEVENQRLKTQLLQAQAEHVADSDLMAENQRLRALLGASQRYHYAVRVASVLQLMRDPVHVELVLDLGKRDGVQKGQAVVDASGVLGQIIRVSDTHSYVLLLSDRRSAIPVQNARSGERGIVEGQGQYALLKVTGIVKTADVKAGDVFVASGLGHRYPSGYPVGVVRPGNFSDGHAFAHIELQPSGRLDRARQVMLIGPREKV